MITIVNTEDMTANTSTPLGVMESIWGLVAIPMEFVSIFDKIAFYTSNGLYIGMITAEGEFQTCEDVFFQGCDVTNAQIIKDDLLLCTLIDQDGISKLMAVDVDEEKVELILD